METIIVLGLLLFIAYKLMKQMNRSLNSEARGQRHAAENTKISKRERFLPPIPDGHKILYERIEVAGIAYRADDAALFIMDSDQSLRLSPEPSNPHDENAIKVIGVSKHGSRHIGYVPREIAEDIANEGLLGAIEPRLRYINLQPADDHQHYIDVEFDITGPKPKN